MLSMILDALLVILEAVVGASGAPQRPRWAHGLWVACCVLLALAAVAAIAYAVLA